MESCKESFVWDPNILQAIIESALPAAAEWEAGTGFKKYIVEGGKRLKSSGLTVEMWGNISIRDPEAGLAYLTPSAMKYSTTVEDDVVVCRLNGAIVEGHRRPTIETGLHLAVYRNREEINAVIHTHPMYFMVYVTQDKGIPLIIDEAARAMGDTCKCTQYALPGSEKLAAEYGEVLGRKASSCLLYSRGVVCVGESMDTAFRVATILEATIRILYMIKAVGGKPVEISPENVAAMKNFAKNYYEQGK